MRDETFSPEVQAALAECLVAAIALAVATGVRGGFLPQEGKRQLTNEELALKKAIQGRACAQNISFDAAERATILDYNSFYLLADALYDSMRQECPTHKPILDFCHGSFGALYETLKSGMGMTPQAFLGLMNEQHQRTSPDCAGFTASETAFLGCRADRLAFIQPSWF